MIKHI